MKIVKKIDDIGRIAIPKDLRRSLRWMGGDEIDIIPKDDGTIVLRKSRHDFSEQLFELQKHWEDDIEINNKFNELIELVKSKTE